MWSKAKSGSQNEFGSLIPVRPHTGTNPARCPWGHDLAIGGRTGGYSHFYDLHDHHCRACRAAGRPGAWATIDPARQATPDTATGDGLELVAIPPAQRAGVGQIEIHLRRAVLGDIDLSLCRVEQRAVIEHIRVDETYRRYGFGRVLVAAALARAPRYHWSSTEITTDHARAFWAAVAPPIALGEPHWCSHMLIAAGKTP